VFELRFVADFAKARVIAMLPAAFRVAARGLYVAVWRRADLDIGPRGWDGERADARKRLLIAHRVTISVAIGEALAGATARQAGRRIGDVPEANVFGFGTG